MNPEISIVVPMHNEEGNAEPLYRAIHAAMGALGKSYEIIFVNDVSDDGTLDILKRLKKSDSAFHYCDLKENVGENWALLAGVAQARGNVIVTLDGDFQNDPAFIPALLRKLDEGYRVVSGWRRVRVGNFFSRVLPSVVANFFISKISGVLVHDCGCGLKAYRREVLEGKYVPAGGMNRFSPVVFGVKRREFAEVEVVDRMRLYGVSHYGLRRLFIVANDLLALPFILRGPGRMRPRIRTFAALCMVAFLGVIISGFLYNSALYIFSIPFFLLFLMAQSIFWNLGRYLRAASSPKFVIREFT